MKRRRYLGKRKIMKLAALLAGLAICLAACGEENQEARQQEAAAEGYSKPEKGENTDSGEAKSEKPKDEDAKDKGSKNETATSGNSQGDFTVPKIEWRLAEPIYEKKDAVVYGYSITDFGVEPGSGADVTGKVQAAMLLLNRAGGGTLYFPAGEYELEGTLNVPKGVTICGDWKQPGEDDGLVEGTVLKVYAGRGNKGGTAQFILQPNSCVRDLAIWYPEQTIDDVKEYPATFQLYDPSVWGADYTHVENVTLVNSYIGVVQGPSGSASANVRNLYGTTLHTGISFDGLVDVGRCDFVSLSPDYWIQSGFYGNQDEQKLRDYLRQNAVGITIGRVDWSYFANTEIEGYAIGMRLREGEMNEQGNFPNGQVYCHTYKDCAVGLQVDGVASAGEAFASLRVEGCDIGIRIEDNPKANNGSLEFYDAYIDAKEAALIHESSGDVSMTECEVVSGRITTKNGCLLLASTSVQEMEGSKIIVTKSEPVEIRTAPEMEIPVCAPARRELYVFEEEISDEEDMTASIQTLLDKAGEEGGGIVFLPPGEYCVRNILRVPEGVELRGAIDVGRNPIRIGTILRVRPGASEEEATVTLSENSGMKGIVFDYPEQNFINPIPYPCAIRGDGSNIYVVNVSVRGAYRGLDFMTNRCDGHYVEYLSGICLKNGIQVGAGSKDGRIYDTQFNFIVITAGDESKFGTWDNAPKGSAKEEEIAKIGRYLQENLVEFELGDVENQLLYDNFSYNGLVGIRFIEENGRAASGWCVGHGVDYSSTAFDIEGLGNMGFVNTQLVSFRKDGTQVDEICHIRVNGDVDARFVNLACWARPDTANILLKDGALSIWNMRLYNMPSTSAKTAAGTELYLGNYSCLSDGQFSLFSGEGKMTLEGGVYGAGFQGGAGKIINAHNRAERMDMPANALYTGEGQLLLAEGFTGYPALNNKNRTFATGGNFDKFQEAGEHAYVGLSEENGESFARLFCDKDAVQTYIQSSALSMQQKGVYELEMRLCVSEMGCTANNTLIVSMTGTKDGKEAGKEILCRWNGDASLEVGNEELTRWQMGEWYRLKLIFDFEREGKRTVKTTLADDEGNELISSKPVALRQELQDGNCALGNLQCALIGDGIGNNDVLLDYVLAWQSK